MGAEVVDPNQQPESVVGLIGNLTKAAAFVALLAYGLGLIITNTWLYYSGVSEFELFRPRFVMTGLLALALLLLSAAGVMSVRWAVISVGEPSDESNKSNKSNRVLLQRILVWTSAAFLAVIPLLLMFIMLAPRDRPVVSARGIAPGSIFLIYALGLAVAGGALLIWANVSGTTSEGALTNFRPPAPSHVGARGSAESERTLNGVLRRLVGVWLALLLVVAFVAWILQFSKVVYPRLPEQFGGTRGRLVMLLLDESIATQIEASGVDVTEDLVTCGRVELLFLGSDFYLIRLPGEADHQIVLSADLVKGFVTEGGQVRCP